MLSTVPKRLSTLPLLVFLASGSFAGREGGTEDLASSSWVRKASENLRLLEYTIQHRGRSVIPNHPGGLQAANRAQNLRAYFRPEGLDLIQRTGGSPTWVLHAALRRMGPDGDQRQVEAVSPFPKGRTVTYPHPKLLQRYENTPGGIRWELHLPWTEETPGSKVTVAIRTGLVPFPALDGQEVGFYQDHRRVLRIRVTGAHDSTGRSIPVHLGVDPGELTIHFQPPPLLMDNGPRGNSDVTSLPPLQLNLLWTGSLDASAPTGLSRTPDWLLSGAQAGAGLGTVVATAGDVNGDGFSDILAAAPLYDNGEIDEGRVFLYLGSPSGLNSSPAWTAEGDQTGARFGASLSTAGDVNGDGFDDILIGAPQYDQGESDEGMVFLYLGSPSGPAGSPIWTHQGNQTGSRFGTSVAIAGDVNRDGFSDVLVGAPDFDAGQADEGKVFLFSGSGSGLPGSPAWTATGGQAGARFGATTATAGDVNGDGFSDLLVGAPDFDVGGTEEGRIFLYLGSLTGPEDLLPWSAEGQQIGARFGTTVGTAGDVNGDGFSDALAGAPFHDNGLLDQGRVSLFLGSSTGLGSTAAWMGEGTAEGARFGSSLATAGDVNGDGFADLAIGSPGLGNALGEQGGTSVYLGSPSGPTEPAWWSVEGDAPLWSLGASVAPAGDLNGDGFGDLLVGVPGMDTGGIDAGGILVFHGSASGPQEAPSWSGEGGQFNAEFGFAAASAGDVNGDGFGDVILGAWLYDNGELDEGRVFVYHGSRDGLSTVPDWSAESDQANASFGRSVGTAGDVNGDGFSDVIIGAFRFSSGKGEEGGAFVYHGSPGGLASSPAWTARGDQTGAFFGLSVATAGDVNGDGFGDVIVGAPSFDGGDFDQGRAFLFLGSREGLSREADWFDGSARGGDWYGISVSTAGDVNGDGFSDVIVGIWLSDNGEADEGSAAVYLGSPTGLSGVRDWTVEADQANSWFGWSVATAGDVNGDGFSDVLIGAPFFDQGEFDEGVALLFLGSDQGLDPLPAWTVEGNQVSARMGRSVSTAGDVNGDGFSDVILGAWLFDNGEKDEGLVSLFLGSPTGPGAEPSWTAESDQPEARLGAAVATAGDVNGDGFSDVLVGTPFWDGSSLDSGLVSLYFGNGGNGLDRPPWQARADGTARIAPLGWSESETAFRLGKISRSPAGRGQVHLEWEVQPLGTPFDGLSLGRSIVPLDTGPPAAGVGSFLSLEELVSGLLPGTPYHWRVRTKSDSPFFPRSPWFSLPDNHPLETDLRTAECRDLDGDGFGRPGYPTCPEGETQDCNDQDSLDHPGASERCDGLDNDCDVQVDEDPTGAPLTEACYDGPPDTLDVGVCHAGLHTCQFGAFDICLNQLTPGSETCGTLDLDCDGIPGNPGGDADGSGRVDGGDLGEWARRLGTSLSADPTSPFFQRYRRNVDLDGDGDIDGVDLINIISEFGQMVCSP